MRCILRDRTGQVSQIELSSYWLLLLEAVGRDLRRTDRKIQSGLNSQSLLVYINLERATTARINRDEIPKSQSRRRRTLLHGSGRSCCLGATTEPARHEV